MNCVTNSASQKPNAAIDVTGDWNREDTRFLKSLKYKEMWHVLMLRKETIWSDFNELLKHESGNKQLEGGDIKGEQ